MEKLNDSTNTQPKEIKSEYLLLVEGKNDFFFFTRYLKHIGLDDKVQIFECGGESNFAQKFGLLKKMPNFNTVKMLAIIRDADDDVAKAFKNICDALKDNALPEPITRNQFTANKDRPLQVGVCIVPHEMPEGYNRAMLENVCLQSVADKPLFTCVQNYFACAAALNFVPKDKNNAKAQVQVYLAAQEELKSSIGSGSDRAYWDFNHAAFSQLKDFLQLFNEQ